MIYRLYASSANTVGLDEYLSYSEIDDQGWFNRHLEISAHGTALRYSRNHLADTLGCLPEGQWDEREASKPEYGRVIAISGPLFEAVWAATHCINDHEQTNRLSAGHPD